VLALQQPIGVLVLAGNRGNADLKDDQLTTSLGIALGLSLENLKQREELHESEERLRTVVTGAPIVLFATDADGVFTLVEGRAFDALNVDAAQVVGRSVTQVYAGRPELLADVYRALAGEEVTAIADIGGFVMEIHLCPVRGPEGDVTGLIGVATDVSARRRAGAPLPGLGRRRTRPV